MSTTHSPLQIFCLMVNFVVVVLTTLVAFTDLGRQFGFPEAIPGLLRNDLEKVSIMQPSPISPPPWVHGTWGVILFWQILWSLHGVISICRTSQGYPVYTNPMLLSPLLLLVFMFACGFNVSWFILYDRMYTSTSCLFIFLTTSTIWATYGISLSALYWNIYRMEKSQMYLEIFLTRTLVQNGLAAYAMWGLFVLAFNVAVALQHNTNTQVNDAIAAIAGASIIGCGQLIYFIVDITSLDRYSRYIITPYIIPVYVLSACLFRQDNWFSLDISFILLSALLAFSFVAVMLKSAWVAYKVIRNNTGGCDITTSDQASPVDEAYYLLK